MNRPKRLVISGLVAAGVAALVHYFVPGGWGWALTLFGRAVTVTSTWAGALISVPVWLLGIVLALIATVLGLAGLAAFNRLRKRAPETTRITNAEIFGIRWRWNYHQGDIRDLTSYCPMCDIQVQPTEETRHGFLHLISYQCDCGRWRSKSFQCAQVDFMDRVCRTIQQQARP
jgi:hypothetical protein